MGRLLAGHQGLFDVAGGRDRRRQGPVADRGGRAQRPVEHAPDVAVDDDGDGEDGAQALGGDRRVVLVADPA